MIWDLVPKEYFCDTYNGILAPNCPRYYRIREVSHHFITHLNVMKGASSVCQH